MARLTPGVRPKSSALMMSREAMRFVAGLSVDQSGALYLHAEKPDETSEFIAGLVRKSNMYTPCGEVTDAREVSPLAVCRLRMGLRLRCSRREVAARHFGLR